MGGWELAYLKICCKVQGVRKDLIAGETLQIVKLTDLKAYFPKRTIFTENCWPPAKGRSLLPKPNPALMGFYGTGGISSQNSVPSTRWTRNVPNENFNQSNSNSSQLSTRTFVNLNSNAMSVNMGTTGISLTNTGNQGQRQFNFMGATVPIGNTASNQYFSATRNGLSPAATALPNPNTTQIIAANGQQIQVPRNQLVAKTINLSKIKAIGPPVELSRLNPIPDHPDGNREGAYTVRMVNFKIQLVH